MDLLMLAVLLVSLCVLGFLIFRALMQRDHRRLPAILTALTLSTVFAKISIDIYINPSSHNLLPFELIIWNLIGLTGYWIGSAIIAKIKGIQKPDLKQMPSLFMID